MTNPHVPAAFINAIAEEGTKSEAVDYLQKQWNESCALRSENAFLKARIKELTNLLQAILSADQEFRDQLPQDWEGDPLYDACQAASANIKGSRP